MTTIQKIIKIIDFKKNTSSIPIGDYCTFFRESKARLNKKCGFFFLV